MNGAYLYCIAPIGHGPAPGLRGVDDRPVEGVDAGRFTIWVSTVDAPPAPSVERARRHNAVVMAAATERVTPIPVRFGQWFRSADDLVTRVRSRESEYGTLLREVAGAVEFGLRFVDPAVQGGAEPDGDRRAGRGRAYMAGLARRMAAERAAAARGAELADALRGALGALVRRDRVDAPGTATCPASVSHLVRRADIAAYRARLAEFRAGRPGLQIVESGPWPPYSFVA